MLYNNQSNKISKKTNKLINYTQEEMCFNVEYSMEYLLRELNYQYLEELKFQRENLVNDQIYGVGERVGQMIIMPYPQIEFEPVLTLSETERGTGGFGSSGK